VKVVSADRLVTADLNAFGGVGVVAEYGIGIRIDGGLADVAVLADSVGIWDL
jgi:hypothetical protein